MESIAAVAPVNAMFFSALLVLLKLVLGIRVTMYRAKHNTMWGDAGDEQMQRRIRAHANHSEWMPATIIILALIEMVGVAPIIVFVLGAAMLVGRLIHSIGLMGNAEMFNRVTGMVITWLVLGVSALIGIVEYFAPGAL
ncbi:MAG: MAPEG family protein [Alphaproteobacteria bacterium]|nr:MAPEG family protein [Alphaproteobacteria bacterium]